MTSRPWFRLLVLVLVFVGLGSLLRMGRKGIEPWDGRSVPRDSILHLNLDGVIINGKRFLQTLKDYGDEPNVKAVVVTIDSPGGAVGPSQEINEALTRLRERRKIPVICNSSGLMASGAYYSAVACDRIVVSAGALVGSIGVIMEFANIGRLYEWAKVERYSITSGKFKDSGAEYRPMRADERELFQGLIDEVYRQFKDAIAAGRPQLDRKVLDEQADGRVFTGYHAVEMGFADRVGTLDDAVGLAREMGKLDAEAELFEPPRPRRNLLDWGTGTEDPVNTVTKAAMKMMKLELLNRPLFLMPGTWETLD